MNNVIDRYVYRVHWSDECEGFVGTVAEMPELRFVSDSFVEALTGIRISAHDEAAKLVERGVAVPIPFEDRHYSGHFMVRVPPEVHRRLSIEAAEQGVSLNRLVQARLS